MSDEIEEGVNPRDFDTTTAGRLCKVSGQATHPEGAVLPTPEADEEDKE